MEENTDTATLFVATILGLSIIVLTLRYLSM